MSDMTNNQSVLVKYTGFIIKKSVIITDETDAFTSNLLLNIAYLPIYLDL